MIQVQKQMDPVEMSEEIRRRDEQAEHIEKTMLEVNDIYKDLANLVSDQGSMLQSIEANIDDTNSRVEHGLTDLVCGTSARSIPGAENAQDLPRDRERARARARACPFLPTPATPVSRCSQCLCHTRTKEQATFMWEPKSTWLTQQSNRRLVNTNLCIISLCSPVFYMSPNTLPIRYSCEPALFMKKTSLAVR